MKKVIQVVDTLNTGGAERVALDLANGLVKIGYQVFFVLQDMMDYCIKN